MSVAPSPLAAPEAPPEPPAPDEVRVRPLRRLSRRTALLVEAAVAVVVVVLAVNLLLAMRSDRGGDHPSPQPAGAGPVDTPIPPTGSTVDDFAGPDGRPPGGFPGLGTRWTVEGRMATRDGVLFAEGPAVARVGLPEGERLLQVVLASPNEGWTVAFSYDGPDTYWAVALGPQFSTLVEVVDGEAEIVARTPILTPGWVEVLVTWRDGRVVVDSGGLRLWSGEARAGSDTGRMALIATGATPGGIDAVAVRQLEA